MPRRRKHKDAENQERWLITYSDLITLLMIFFVIMYAMSKVDQVKFASLQQSLSQALHQTDKIPNKGLGSTGLLMPTNPADANKPNPPQAANSPNTKDQKLDNLYAQIQQYINKNNLQGNVSVLDQQRGVQITLRDVVLFDTGQAAIKPQAQGILKGLIPFFKQVQNSIVIEGYTDDQPITTAQYPSNWELSSARAIDVVRYVISQGVAPDRLSGVGYGQYHGLVPNDSAAHRQMNRRVNIVILRQSPLSGSGAQTSTNSTAGATQGK